MLKAEVETIFEENKSNILEDLNIKPHQNPVAILLGGQPAAGKSSLTEAAKANHPDKKFLVINGDNYREYHPEHNKLIREDIDNFSKETQLFSNVFTEGFIKEAIRKKYNVIIEGTMRNPATPLHTAEQLRNAGFRVEAYVIAAPSVVTEMAIFNRYQEEVEIKGAGRLSDMDTHNEAVKGLPVSLDKLYDTKAVDKISIYTYQSRKKVADFMLADGNWNTLSKPSSYIEKAIDQQLKDQAFISEIRSKGYKTLEEITPKLKKGLRRAIDHSFATTS